MISILSLFDTARRFWAQTDRKCRFPVKNVSFDLEIVKMSLLGQIFRKYRLRVKVVENFGFDYNCRNYQFLSAF